MDLSPYRCPGLQREELAKEDAKPTQKLSGPAFDVCLGFARGKKRPPSLKHFEPHATPECPSARSILFFHLMSLPREGKPEGGEAIISRQAGSHQLPERRVGLFGAHSASRDEWAGKGWPLAIEDFVEFPGIRRKSLYNPGGPFRRDVAPEPGYGIPVKEGQRPGIEAVSRFLWRRIRSPPDNLARKTELIQQLWSVVGDPAAKNLRFPETGRHLQSLELFDHEMKSVHAVKTRMGGEMLPPQ